MRDVVDEIFYNQRADLIALICGSIFAAFAIRGIATYGQAVILARIGNNLVARYQRRMFDHLMKLDIGFFNENRSGYLAAQINQNVTGIRDLLGMTLTSVARDVVVADRAGRRHGRAGPGAVADRLADRAAAGLHGELPDAPPAPGDARIGRGELAPDRRHAGGDAGHRRGQGLHHGRPAVAQDVGRHRRRREPRQQDRPRLRAPDADRRGAGRLRHFRRHRLCRLPAAYYSQPPGGTVAFITALLLAYDPARRLARLQVDAGALAGQCAHDLRDPRPRAAVSATCRTPPNSPSGPARSASTTSPSAIPTACRCCMASASWPTPAGRRPSSAPPAPASRR